MQVLKPGRQYESLIAAAVWLASLSVAPTAQAQAPRVHAQPETVVDAPSDPRLRGFRWRSIGPAGPGGRVDDLAIDERNPSTYYIGFAVSGVWKTVNHGTTFQPIFDIYGVSSIGDLALAPSDPDILYVGTGEANYRQSSSVGNGIWKSTDGGGRFTHVGLADSQSIARIVVHPTNPDVVWVAVAGHLFGPNAERGVFMTTDGGAHWARSLFVDENTGAADLVIDPGNPNHLFAAMYEYRRTAWGYVGGGPGSGIYRSTDGGRSWSRLTGNGLPHGTMGRIGLDISRSQPNVVYAQIEVAPNGSAPPPDDLQIPSSDGPAPSDGGQGGGTGAADREGRRRPDAQFSGIWRSVDGGATWQFRSNENQRPMYFSQIRVDPNDPDVIYVGGVNARKSLDGGRTFIDIEAHKGHVDNHAIWIDPASSQHVMYGSDGGLEVTWDGGMTWEAVRLFAVGLAYHVSADLRRPYWVCTGLQDNGSWCGPSRTRAGGIRAWNWVNVGAGDGFQSQIDPTNPDILYTESQNLGLQRYDLAAGTVTNIRPNPFGREGSAEGRNVLNLSSAPAELVTQFNWNAPVRLSPHDPATLYAGGRQLFISRDRGETWTMTQSLGKDLDVAGREMLGQPYRRPACGRAGVTGRPCILSKHDGYLQHEYGTLTELAESPVRAGVLWAGTDDGNVQVSQDGGLTFTEVGRNIPGINHEYYVSGLEASWHDAAAAYVALDGHRHDDWRPFVFKTSDYGRTWQPIASGLPAFGQVNAIRQDPVNARLLYAATEVGFFISLDEGVSWTKFMPGLPDGRVDEVLVHPREHDLILATHSRSLWILDDISPLQQLRAGPVEAPFLFTPRDAVQWKPDRRDLTDAPGDKVWRADPAPRGTTISYLLSSDAREARIAIAEASSGRVVFVCEADGLAGLQPGMNRIQWPFFANGAVLEGRRAGTSNRPMPCSTAQRIGVQGMPADAITPGAYRVTLTVDGVEVDSKTFQVLEDVWMRR